MAVAESRFDADLGGGVFKQRVARAGGGKSGGFRTLIVFRRGQHSYFVHGFAKSGKSNVSARELRALKELADALLRLSALQLSTAIEGRELIEIKALDDETENQG